MKALVAVAVPLPVVTTTFLAPAVPAGTVQVIWVGDWATMLLQLMPPRVTPVVGVVEVGSCDGDTSTSTGRTYCGGYCCDGGGAKGYGSGCVEYGTSIGPSRFTMIYGGSNV